MARTKKAPRDIYQEVTDKMVAMLEAGTIPWQRPWATTAPMRMSSRTPYRGINIWLLEPGEGPGGNWWGTYDKITELGGQVRKGEKGYLATFTRTIEKEDGEKFFMYRAHKVFNAAQADWPEGMPEHFLTVRNTEDPIAAAEAIHHGYQGRPAVIHGGSRACYSPNQDKVMMPLPETFTTREHYYGVLFHELTHSTGHATRLGREGVTNPISFGSHTYGLEELIAEMGSAMLTGVAGIEGTFDNSAAYLASWLDTIRESPQMVVRAASSAQRACDWILGVKWGEKEDS